MDSLRKERIKLGYSQKDFAEKLGVTTSYLSRIENGKAPFSSVLYDKISVMFNLDTESKIDSKVKEELNPQSYEIYKKYIKQIESKSLKKSSKVNSKYNDLSLESQKMVDNFIDALYEAEKKNEENK